MVICSILLANINKWGGVKVKKTYNFAYKLYVGRMDGRTQ